MHAYPDPDEVRRIVSLDDNPILRNLLISQGYHDLGEALRERTSGGLNWCTLGSWASKTAGTFIRGDEVPRAFRGVLTNSGTVEKWLSAHAPIHPLDAVEGIVREVGAYIEAGNKTVFAELAGVVSRFLVELGGDTSPDPARLRSFQASLSDGPPEPDALAWNPDHTVVLTTQRGGQGQLRAMVAAYYAAMFETDAKRQAEWLLLGNAHGGIHEQTRLQSCIAGSLDAPVADLLLGRIHAHLHTHGGIAEHLLDTVLHPLARGIEEAWETFATHAMMTLPLPDGVLHLGSPLPEDHEAPPFPPALTTLTLPRLCAVLSAYDVLTVPEGAARDLKVGASDWVDLRQRLRFILVLFRSRAQDPHLYAAPFSSAQREAIAAGRIPTEGAL